MQLRFKIDTTRLENSMRSAVKVMESGMFGKALESAGKGIIEANIKRRFQENIKRYPSATPEGTGEHSTKILEEIKTQNLGYDRKDKNWMLGIGNIGDLDRASVLQSLAGKEYYLWRILEKGAKPPPGGIVAKQYPFLTFWWYRKGVYFVGKFVVHPGQEGRHYFLTMEDEIYEEDKKFTQQVENMIMAIVREI